MLGALLGRVRRLEALTRPAEPEMLAALRRRWEELPAHVKQPAQLLGRRSVGCEGTHGVFPRCNLACTPCYHSRDANRVRVDGAHTLAEVDRQLAYLRARRGPRAFAQLIGGEVSLLSPEDHAATLQVMRAHGREPMSMSHGDFDWDYLRRLALGPNGRPRVARLSFAGHFDSLMLGRRDLPRPTSERELNPYRARPAQARAYGSSAPAATQHRGGGCAVPCRYYRPQPAILGEEPTSTSSSGGRASGRA